MLFCWTTWDSVMASVLSALKSLFHINEYVVESKWKADSALCKINEVICWPCVSSSDGIRFFLSASTMSFYIIRLFVALKKKKKDEFIPGPVFHIEPICQNCNIFASYRRSCKLILVFLVNTFCLCRKKTCIFNEFQSPNLKCLLFF